MLKSLRVRVSQGTQYISDLRKSVPSDFRGRPVIDARACATDCHACLDVCPTGAIALDPVRIDLAKCVFCNECAVVCPEKKLKFTPEVQMGGRSLDDLVVSEGEIDVKPIEVADVLKRMFGRSLKMRQVSAGGCNGCELELAALANVNFDIQRYGIEWVASPRHADALVITGPLTKNMDRAIRSAWDAMPDPRFLIATGACAISGGLYAGATGVDRSILSEIGPTLYIPGCPPHPLTFATAVLQLLGFPRPS